MWLERFTSFSVLLFYFSSQSRLVSSALEECNRPLGLQDGRILNSQLSSPSHFEHLYIGNGKNANLKAKFARLNNSLAWCSPSTKNSDRTFIEIDLYQQVNISGIATQGFMGINSYYVKQYKVAYSMDRITWKLPKQVWRGNSDAQTVVKNTFNPVIPTRFLRIYPVTVNLRVCMRMELYGCTNLTTDANHEKPVVTVPTVTVPSTTVRALQSTITSSSAVTPTLSKEITTSSKVSGSVTTAIPTPHSGTTKPITKAMSNALNTVNKMKEGHHTTTVKAPWSVSSEQPAAQTDQVVGEEHFLDDKPVRLSTTSIVILSVASAFLFIVVVPVVVLVNFLQQRKRRCSFPDKSEGIPLHTAVIDENLCNQEFYDAYKYGVPTGKSNAVEFNFLTQGAV